MVPGDTAEAVFASKARARGSGAAGDRIGRIARDAGLFRDAVAGYIVPDIVRSEVAAELELAALACIQVSQQRCNAGL
jgi:hypothetical protein